MRKSFTWFLSLVVFLFVFATNGFAQAQSTVELYAEDASNCYMEANDYTVTISVQDFIQLTRFDLDLAYEDEVFAYTGVSGLHSSLAGTAVSAAGGVINIAWSGSATTIGDNVKTDILVLHFSVLGFPGNTATSFTSSLEWTTSDFFYTANNEERANTNTSYDGSLAVSVEMTGIEVEFTSETCAGGDVTVTVTAPEADMYLFNEGVVVANWEWTDSPDYLVSAGEVVTIRVKDADGCISLREVVNVPETVEPVAFTVTTQDPACYGGKGSVVINASGGSAPYKYYISENADGTGAIQKSNFQFSMDPGTYYVNVQDANDCADLEWVEITITDNNAVLEVGATATDVGCYGESTGEIATTVVQGDLTMVSLDGVVWHPLPYTFEDLPAGTYDVHARNDNGCAVTLDDVVVAEPDEPIMFDIEIDDTSCGGDNDGVITVVNVTGGTGAYSYSIDGVDFSNNTGVFTGLAPTYYSLWVQDEAGCIVAYNNPNGTGNTIAVQSPDDIQFDVVVTDPACNDEDAMVWITNVSGGSGDYIYSFDGGGTWVDTTSMMWASPYDPVTVWVANADESCPVELVVDDVENPEILDVSVYNELPPTCVDGNDGNVTLEISGGVSPYYYSVNGSSWKMTSNQYTNIRLSVGTHTIMVKDDNDCEYDMDIEVDITLENNVIEASSSDIGCFGDKTATIAVDFISWSGGLTGDTLAPVRSVEYYVENSGGQVASFTPANHGGTPTLFSSGTYVVWVVDQYTCESNTDTVMIDESAELNIQDVIANGASCFQSFEGSITIHATGGNTDELQYAVVNNEGALGNIEENMWLEFDTYDDEVDPPLSTVTFNVDAGTYWIAVRDDDCAELTYGPITVEGYTELLVDEDDITWTDPKCNADSTGTITVPMSAVSGGAGAYYFTLLVDDEGWEMVEGMDSMATGEFKGLPSGTYAVLVEDGEGCPSYTTESITLTDPAVLTYTTSYMNIRCEGTNDGRITVTAVGGTPDYWYAINNMNTWVAFGEDVTSKTYIATEPGTFRVWVKDAGGCISGPDTVTIMEPVVLGADITVSDASCYGVDDGEIDIVGTGGWEGMTTYEFAVDSATTNWTSATNITGLSAGTHTLYIRDVNVYAAPYQDLDCVESVDFTIGEPDPITYDVVIENVKCMDGSDATFTVNVQGGGTPWYSDDDDDTNDGYDVRLTGDAYDSGFLRTGLDNTITFDGLAAGIYTVYIEDANGCTLAPTAGDETPPYTTIESWEVAQPDTELMLDAEWLNDVTCFNGEDGSFVIHASGGTAPYKYFAGRSILPDHILLPDPESDDWVDNDTMMVSAGTWIVWVMDANGCVKGGEVPAVSEWRVAVLQPDSVMWDFHMMGEPLTVHYKQPDCFGDWNGEVHLVDITGGSGVYGAHVWGTNYAGEEVNIMYDSITASGGIYRLAGVPASDTMGFLVTVMDENGCTSMIDTIWIDQPEELMVTLQESEDNYSCAGAVEGWIEATATGGTPGYEYQLWKNGVIHTPWQSIASAFLVQVGNQFIVQVRDANGCEVLSDTLNMPTPAEVDFTYDDLTCGNDEKPSVRINAMGTEGRQFQVWYRQIEDNPDPDFTAYDGWFSESIIIDDAFDFDNVNINDLHYALYIVDDHGCESPVDTLTFDQVQVPITVDWETGNETECSEDVMVNSMYGGFGDLTITVNDTIVLAVGETYTMPRGTHVLKVTDEHECAFMQEIEVVGMYVTRDTIIEAFIGGYDAEFVDEEAGVDTMLAVGMHTFVYTVDCERTLNVEVIEVARPLTIADVQGEGFESPWVGDIVAVTGTITAIAENEGFFMQDAVAANSGIWVEWTDVTTVGMIVGDPVTVTGEVAEVADVTSIVSPTVVVATDTPEITPLAVTPSDAESEMYESVLVIVEGARATAALSNGQWDIYYEANDNITVNDWLYSSTPVEDHFYDVTGVVNGRLDAFLLEPRMESDVVDLTATAVDPELANSFKVYPNPFNDKIYIDNNDMLTRVVITNIAGQRVIDVEYPEREIRTANLVSGVYLVNLFDESGLVKTDRIVKR